MSQPTSSHSFGDERNSYTSSGISISPDLASLRALASEIRVELEHLQDHDPIHACGKAALAILQNRPLEALQLAKDHVQNTPFRDVRKCWLRLYEDASLWRAAELLCDDSYGGLDFASSDKSPFDRIDWMSQVVRVLDLGLVTSGGTLRASCMKPFLRTSNRLSSGAMSVGTSLVYSVSISLKLWKRVIRSLKHHSLVLRSSRCTSTTT